MLELIFLLSFSMTAILYIFIESVKAQDIKINNSFILNITKLSTFIKAIPTGLTTIFVFLMRPSDSPFYFILTIGFLFCMVGDIGMEKGLVQGLIFFLFAQIFFSVAFIYQSIKFDITIDSLVIPILVAVGMISYTLLLMRYLESSEARLGKFKAPGITYFIFIGLMLVSAVLLWTTSKKLEFGIVIIGGLLFIISDSTIAVNQFHHNISYREIKVMSTYYAAILLISFAVLII